MKTHETLGQRIQAELLAIPKFGNGIGLHRMRALCEPLLQTPWMSDLDAIKVTGSNGKGSVCAMAAAVFGELGMTCGLYTSPHLIRFNERIVTDGEGITGGAFEAFTAIALYHFARKQPRVLVAEAGIGGRFDSTRIIPGKIVALTSL